MLPDPGPRERPLRGREGSAQPWLRGRWQEASGLEVEDVSQPSLQTGMVAPTGSVGGGQAVCSLRPLWGVGESLLVVKDVPPCSQVTALRASAQGTRIPGGLQAGCTGASRVPREEPRIWFQSERAPTEAGPAARGLRSSVSRIRVPLLLQMPRKCVGWLAGWLVFLISHYFLGSVPCRAGPEGRELWPWLRLSLPFSILSLTIVGWGSPDTGAG